VLAGWLNARQYEAMAYGRLAIAAGIAVVIAILFAVPRIAGIETWKWVLGAIGMAFIVLAGRKASGD